MARTQLPNALGTLLSEIIGGETHPLAPELAAWLGASKRFGAFAETYRDKIRKKVRTAGHGEGLADLECELAMAYLLLQEPRFAVQYELHNAGKQRAPDFTITYRDNLLFQLEVTRLHARPRHAPSAPPGEDSRLANTLCGKLGQMQPGAINVLAMFTDGETYGEAGIVATTRALLLRAANKEETYFTGHGFAGSRDFLRRYQRLSGILLIAGRRRGPHPQALTGSGQALVWENNQARHPIPGPILTILRRIVATEAHG